MSWAAHPYERAKHILSGASDPAFRQLLASDPSTARQVLAQRLGVDVGEIPPDAFERARRVALDAARPEHLPQAWAGRERIEIWPVERFSTSLAHLLEAGFKPEAPPKTARFAWLPAHLSGSGSQTERLTGAIEVSAMVKLFEPIVRAAAPDESPRRLLECPHLREQLSAEQAKAVAIYSKEVNAAVFSAPCFDLTDVLASRREIPLSERKRIGGEPSVMRYKVQDSPLDDHPSARLGQADGAIEGQIGLDYGYKAVFFNRAPIGEYGSALSSAIVDAVRIAMADADQVIASLQATRAAQTLAGSTTTQQSLVDLIREGIVSVGQTLALLLTHAPRGVSLDELLERIASSGLIAHVAAQVPFGVIGPMIADGRVPSDPISFDDAGRPQLPPSLRELIRDVHATRQLMSAEAASFETIADARDNRTQTLMGCPVAGRAPKVGANGAVEIAPEPALVGLASEIIELVRRSLREGAQP